MSESAPNAAVENATFLAERQSQDAGALLKQAREAAGLHIGALAVALKVPVRKLEALESGRFDLLPDAVFARALASSVCRNLKIDPAPVLARLPAVTAHNLSQRVGHIGDKFYEPGGRSAMSIQSFFAHPVALIVFALVIASAVVYFWPSFQGSATVSEAASPKNLGKVVASPVPFGEPSAGKTASGVGNEPGAFGATASPIVSMSSSGVQTVGAIAPPLEVGTANAQTALPANNSTTTFANATLPVGVGEPNGIVVLKTRGTSWVEVTDAQGVVQLRKIMVAGESVGVSGGLPLSVTVGKADAVDVQVRGKPFDLALLSKDNVARFEVK